MNPSDYFRHPQDPGQRQYEALRASFLERLPARGVAERFQLSPGYVHVLRHRFRRGLLCFTFRPAAGPGTRRGTPAGIRARIIELRRQREISAGQIAEIVEDEGIEISVRTVERILREAGFPKLPRRTRLLIGETRARTTVPEVSRRLAAEELTGMTVHSDLAGLFAGLNVLPKYTAMSTYAYSLDEPVLGRRQRGVAKAGQRLGLYTTDTINLDFHAVPHWGDESVLDKRLRGFEECNAPQIFRHFIRGKGQVTVTADEVRVRYPKRAHNLLLRRVPWNILPERVSWLGDRRLRLEWQ